MLRGQVEALDLVQILQLLHDNGATGELQIWSGKRRETLVFVEGRLALSRASAKKTRAREEAIYELLFLEHGSYAFMSSSGKFTNRELMFLDTTTILVEATRRKDEWARIHRNLPTFKGVLRARDAEAAEDARSRLREVRLFTGRSLGEHSIEELVAKAERAAFPVLQTLSSLCEEGVLGHMPLDVALERLRRRVSGRPRREAYRLFEWLHETQEPIAELEGFDHVLLKRRWMVIGGFRCRAAGPRALQIISRLLRYGEDFRFTAQANTAAIAVRRVGENITARYRGFGFHQPIMDRVQRSKLMSAEEVKDAEAIAERYQVPVQEVLVERGFLTAREWTQVKLDHFLDLCFSIFSWNRPSIQVDARVQEELGEDGDAAITFELTSELDRPLRVGILKWKLFQKVVPSMDAIFRCVRPRKEGEPLRAHDYCDGKRRVSDLLAMARASGLELLQYIYRGVKSGVLKPLSADGHRRRMSRAIRRKRHARLIALYRSAHAFGLTSLTEDPKIKHWMGVAEDEEGRKANDISVLEGRLGNFNLAEIIQLCLRHQIHGTLRVSYEDDERLLHFVDGGLYIILTAEERAAAAPNDFLTESTEEVMGALRTAFEDEDGALQRVRERLKDEVLEALFWEGARFELTRNFVPSEFDAEDHRFTKVRLSEDRLLFEAIGQMAEWDELSHVLRSPLAVFAFISPTAREEGRQGYGRVARLLNGRRTLEEIVKGAKAPRLKVYRAVFDMIEAGLITLLDIMRSESSLDEATAVSRWDLSA